MPEAGEVIWVDLNPTLGCEQAGHRPCLVLTPSSYNNKTNLAVACAMTTAQKGYPFEVTMPDGGIILVDQLKTLDWRSRKAKSKGVFAPPKVLQQVRALLGTLLRIGS